MTDALAGSDWSWIGIDGGGRLGWFTLNGAGPAPAALGGDPSVLTYSEARLAAWVRANGRAFEFGAGEAMWQDLAALGVFAFDFYGAADEYRAVARPVRPLSVVPDELAGVVVRMPAADFDTGRVSRGDVADAE